MVTLKNSQLLQIGTSLVSRRPSRPCKIFKRPENREDSSDFDDFLTKTIAATQTFFSKIFASPKFSRRRKIFVTSSPGKFYFRGGSPTPLFSTPLIFPGDRKVLGIAVSFAWILRSSGWPLTPEAMVDMAER